VREREEEEGETAPQEALRRLQSEKIKFRKRDDGEMGWVGGGGFLIIAVLRKQKLEVLAQTEKKTDQRERLSQTRRPTYDQPPCLPDDKGEKNRAR